MKNTPLIAGVSIIVLLLLGGGFYLLSTKSKTAAPEQKVPEKSAVMMQQTSAPKTGGVFESIKDIFSKQLSLKCEFKAENGTSTTTYIKNGAILTKVPKSTVLMKDKKIYMWQDGKTDGFMMEFNPDDYANTKAGDAAKAPSNGIDAQQAFKDLEKYKQSCKPEVVDDTMFVPPQGVNFTDFGAMMKKYAVPSGTMPQ